MFRSGFHFSDPSQALLTVEGAELPIFLALGVALTVAEVLLARKRDKRLGLILPGFFFGWAAVKFAVRAVFYHPAVDNLCLALLVENVPALWLLVVCALCMVWGWGKTARQAGRDRSLDKTRIDDL